MELVNILWGLLIVIGIVYGLLSGNINEINNEIIVCGKKGLDMILEIMPILVIWMGLMKIAEESGLLKKIANFFYPLLKRIFPSLPKDSKALGYIASNIAVNMMGLGSAATPFGLKAMDEMQKINKKKDEASDAMITFLVLNTSGVTLIPTTVISLRMLNNSTNPSEIILPAILATFIASVCGLSLDYVIRRKNR